MARLTGFFRLHATITTLAEIARFLLGRKHPIVLRLRREGYLAPR
jgi:hypothetical protein